MWLSGYIYHLPDQTSEYDIQWNPSNPDTIGPEESVLIREVSLFQGLKSTQTWYLGRKKVRVLFREVSLFQGLKSTHTWNLGRKKVSCLERCPYFRVSSYIEGYTHNIIVTVHLRTT